MFHKKCCTKNIHLVLDVLNLGQGITTIAKGRRPMRVGMPLMYGDDFEGTLRNVAEFERAGLQIVSVPEAYGFDAVSQIGAIAARTSKIDIAAGVLPIFTRTPTLTAMTAAGLDYVSNGRFTLGLGVSGPQVIEGFHGVSYDRPLARTREIVSICRSVWDRVPLSHTGIYEIPLSAENGAVRRPLRLTSSPVRHRIPITIAAIGPKNVALAAEIADGWEPTLFVPELAGKVWGLPLTEGLGHRDPSLGTLDIVAHTYGAITDDVEHYLDALRPTIALYIGGMGSEDQNFYNRLTRRYGFEAAADEIQKLYLAGDKAGAASAIPEGLLRGVSLIGSREYVRERLSDYASAGVTTLNVAPLDSDHAGRLRTIAQLCELAI